MLDLTEVRAELLMLCQKVERRAVNVAMAQVVEAVIGEKSKSLVGFQANAAGAQRLVVESIDLVAQALERAITTAAANGTLGQS